MDLASNSLSFIPLAHGDSVSAVAFSHNGEFVASGGLDGNISVFFSISAQLVALMDGPSEVIVICYSFHS